MSERLLDGPHLSEKVSLLRRRDATLLVLRVHRSASKSDIKTLVKNLFGTTIGRVNTLVVRGKRRCRGRFAGRSSTWKKVYLTLGGEELRLLPGEGLAERR